MKKQYKHIVFWIIGVALWAAIGILFSQISSMRMHLWSTLHECLCYILLTISIICLYYITIKKTPVLWQYIVCVMGIVALSTLAEILIIHEPVHKFFMEYNLPEDIVAYHSRWNIIMILLRNTAIFGVAVLAFSFQKFAQLSKEREKRLASDAKYQAELARRNRSEYLAEHLKYQTLIHKNDAHFFYNILANLARLAKTDNPKTGVYITRFGHLYRFIMDLEAGEKVAIAKDLKYLKDYFELEKIRVSEKYITVTYEENIAYPDVLIAPLLFESFVENAFKYCSMDEGGFIKINVDMPTAESILFVCQNTYDAEERKLRKTSKKGLELIKERLDFLCGKNYQLNIDDNLKDNIFTITLKLFF